MHELAKQLLSGIRSQELVRAGDRVGVAVSGGADSVALFRLFLEFQRELGIVLSVVHFNHQLRGAESDEDESFVADVAGRHKLPFHCARADVRASAAEKHLSLEAAARHHRYDFFRTLLCNGNLDRIATAHTLDDQAETVLLRVIRGAGSRGLAGIYPSVAVGSAEQGKSGDSEVRREHPDARTRAIIRPLLGIGREQLRAYLSDLGQTWREDPSNRDLRHARNRLRHGILPRLERHLNPAARVALGETAEIARGEEDYWAAEIARLLPLVWDGKTKHLRLAQAAERPTGIPIAVRRRLVRAAAESLGIRLEFRHVQEILQIAAAGQNSPTTATLPMGWTVSRIHDALAFQPGRRTEPREYEYSFPVPGAVDVTELQSRFEALVISRGSAYNSGHLLSSNCVGRELTIRNWRPGDRFWPAHTKAPKKVKELLAEQHITGAERKLWPVIACGDNIVWTRGFATPAAFAPQPADQCAVMIQEIPTAAAPHGDL